MSTPCSEALSRDFALKEDSRIAALPRLHLPSKKYSYIGTKKPTTNQPTKNVCLLKNQVNNGILMESQNY